MFQELRWGLNEKQYTEKTKTFGKSIIFSNKLNWSTKDIVLSYRQQFKIEKKFSDMKSSDYIKTRPFNHWTDHNIKVHLFICVLALLGQAFLKLKLQGLNFKESFGKITKNLEKIHKINLFFNKGTYKKVVMPRLNKLQKKLVSSLNLNRYFT